MENNNAPEVEVKNTTVATEATENNQETVTLTKAEADALIQAAEEATRLAQKKAEDAENYKRGMLKYKNKLKEDYGDEEEEVAIQPTLSEERIAQIIEDKLKSFAPSIKPQEDELAKANLKIAELKTALTSRVNTQVTSAGSNVGRLNNSLSAAEKYYGLDVIADMKRRFPNIDIQKVYENEKNQGLIK